MREGALSAAGHDAEAKDDPAQLRRDIARHLKALGLDDIRSANGTMKELIRASHSQHRSDLLDRQRAALGKRAVGLIESFANGDEVDPAKIKPRLVPVVSGTPSAYLFRLATLLWSVPVSPGYGRRLRYLVVDDQNEKLIGLFALGDPVFNLKSRDDWIGWTVRDREKRLVNLMDAYVLGAVPPYAQLIGGKLVASLVGSAEVAEAFAQKYGDTVGIISGDRKRARLVMVTVTSALGRSSLYNRLVLRADPSDADSELLVRMQRIGVTAGYGHFHLSEDIFGRLRQLLRSRDHRYADGHEYGKGPNWRFRLIREGLKALDMDPKMLRHGIEREVYAMPLADNALDFLIGNHVEPILDRPSAATIAGAALKRWVMPRAERLPDYRDFRRAELLDRLVGDRDQTTWL